MSVYNSNISTRQFDAVFDQKSFRSEFRLPENTVFLSNIRLAGMGLDTVSNTLPGTGNFCAKSIQIYDGNQLLDQVLEASLVKNFDAYNNSNDENASIENVLSKNSMGFMASGNQVADAAGTRADPDGIAIRSFKDSTAGNGLTWLSLKNFLPFLGSSLYVPTTVFKNLRVVVNWKSGADLGQMIVDTTQTVNTLENAFLIVDEMVNMEAVKKATAAYKGVVYKAIEHDSVIINPVNPPAGGTLVQSNSNLVNGFNNKTVSRLRVTQTPLDQATWRPATNNLGFGNQGSISTWNTEYQFRVNGSNKLSRNGVDKRNQRLAMLTDTYGICNMPSFQNFTYVPEMTPILPFPQGDLDYTGLHIDEKVQELVVEMTRTGVSGNDRINQALQLNLFGEVTKSLAMNKDGSYTVSYI